MSAAAGGRFAPVPLDAPVPFDGGTLTLPRGRYDWLHLVVRADAAASARVWLHYADGGADPEALTVPAGARVAVRVPVTRCTELERVRLAGPGALALLALTTVAPPADGDRARTGEDIETGWVRT
ncbi:hypothetical protein [Streptomyces sp. NPDC091268]|uniref:hypothetical protein n=1 Tax=Streptomyces sp. NPDC091268 TaxID=3365979 RepID=UPI0038034302